MIYSIYKSVPLNQNRSCRKDLFSGRERKKNYRNRICYSMTATLASGSLTVYEMAQRESRFVQMFIFCVEYVLVYVVWCSSGCCQCAYGTTQGIMVPFNRNIHTCRIDRIYLILSVLARSHHGNWHNETLQK